MWTETRDSGQLSETIWRNKINLPGRRIISRDGPLRYAPNKYGLLSFSNKTETCTHKRDQSMWDRRWTLGGDSERRNRTLGNGRTNNNRWKTSRTDTTCSTYRRGSSDFPRLFGNELGRKGDYGNTTVRKSTNRKFFGSDIRLNILCRNAVRLCRLWISIRSWNKKANDELVDFNYSEDRKISHRPM